MDKTKWIIFAVIVVAIFGGVIWISKSGEKEFSGDANKVITEGPIADHVFGTNAQKVTLIEYGDYQCPGCGKMYQPIKDLTTKYKDRITFVFRNLPLTNLHPNALAAATVVEAAGLQGKYYEMHDLLYESQAGWSNASVDQRGAVFEGYANQLGLNMAQFRTDLDSQAIRDKIARDRSTARKYTIDQTPSLVLNGKLLEGGVATDSQKLTKAIDDAVKAAYK